MALGIPRGRPGLTSLARLVQPPAALREQTQIRSFVNMRARSPEVRQNFQREAEEERKTKSNLQKKQEQVVRQPIALDSI